MAALRNEITEKQSQVEELRDTTQKLTLAHEQLQVTRLDRFIIKINLFVLYT